MTGPTAPSLLAADEDFRSVIGRFASGVTVITAGTAARPCGATVSAMSSLSLEPPMLLVCLNVRSDTGAAIAERGHFGVNVLALHQAELARRFASSAGESKFRGVATHAGRCGALLLDGALATIECRVVEEVRGGTHRIFLGEVEHTCTREGRPLVYFRGRFGRLVPDDAEPFPLPDASPHSFGDWDVA